MTKNVLQGYYKTICHSNMTNLYGKRLCEMNFDHILEMQNLIISLLQAMTYKNMTGIKYVEICGKPITLCHINIFIDLR